MIVISCPHCGEYHAILNGPPASHLCINCGGWMQEVASVLEAHEVFQRISAATVTAEEP